MGSYEEDVVALILKRQNIANATAIKARNPPRDPVEITEKRIKTLDAAKNIRVTADLLVINIAMQNGNTMHRLSAKSFGS